MARTSDRGKLDFIGNLSELVGASTNRESGYDQPLPLDDAPTSFRTQTKNSRSLQSLVGATDPTFAKPNLIHELPKEKKDAHLRRVGGLLEMLLRRICYE